ncbi:MAG TPA: OpgC domain-containing protein [Vicinamibacterales bacterium]|nr:OpgC domain-containing protein [Vicinamibacterales bacterium]
MGTIPFYAAADKRDTRIDWLRGLAMTCVIINHSKLVSLLSWFSYERFWLVTAAEVFVVLSGVVLGMVYGRRLARDGWRVVVRGLGRRALLLYGAFIGVTVSVAALAAVGVDVRSLAPSDKTAAWLVAPNTMTASAWRDVLFMRAGPWAFEIIGLYVWLVAAAIPCLLILRRAGWRAVLAASWALYLWYRVEPHAMTAAGFESAFPLLAWQLLFVHGITIGYHRNDIGVFFARMPAITLRVAVLITAGFTIFALCNPWSAGPSWLHVRVVSPERFTYLYEGYFSLSDLRIGRLLNLSVALPVAYVMLTRYWALARPLEKVFVVLGQRSLGAFVLHVYGLLVLAHLPLTKGIWINTLAQVTLVITIATLLNGTQGLRHRHRNTLPPRAEPIAA